MTLLLLVPVLVVLGGGVPPEGAHPRQPLSVLKVDPPSWWPGHTINPVRLLIRGTNLHGAHLVTSRQELSVGGVRINERGTYLFVSLRIDPSARLAMRAFSSRQRPARLPFPSGWSHACGRSRTRVQRESIRTT